MRRLATCTTLILAACGTGDAGQSGDAATRDAALESITSGDLLRHIEVLASDSFEGRAPGTLGEERTVRYLTAQFERLGLQPGNPDGTFIQNVPLVGITPRVTASFLAGGQPLEVQGPRDLVASTRRAVPRVDVAKTLTWYSSGTASSHPNTAGMITRAWI